MKLFDREYYQLMEQFEKNYKGCFRLDKEEKSLWPKGIIYEHPEANALFLAFRLGVAYGKIL